MPEITRYKRGETSYNPIIEAPQGELVLAKDALPLVSEVERLEGVVKDLNASVEELTRILANKNGLLESTIATCDVWFDEREDARKMNRTWKWLATLLASMVSFQAGVIKGWW